MSISYTLTIIKGEEKDRTYKVDRPDASLGRHSGQNDVVLNDPYISSKHARIRLKSGRFFLEDLDSTNKTFVNGVALVPGKPVALADEMEFTLGKTAFRFSVTNVDQTRIAGENTRLEFSRAMGKMTNGFESKKLLRYTPVLLGIALWAFVVIVFWIISSTIKH